MRVLVVTTVHTPLDARIYRRQIGALLDAGVGVTYAAPWAATGTKPPSAPGLAIREVPRTVGRKRLAPVRAARRLLGDEAAEHDVLLLHDPDLLLAVATLRGLPPVVWDVHEDTAAALLDRSWVPTMLRPVGRMLVRAAEHWAERRWHLLLAEHAYKARFRCDHPVVPNVPPVPASVPREPGGERAVYVGRISRSRGALAMLELGRRLAPRISVELIGPADPDVVDEIRRAVVRNEVRWHGFLPNAEALPFLDGAMAGLSLLADQPNYRHSMPTKVLEYLAYGVPVVATPLPVTAEVVRVSGGGVLVPFDDVDETERVLRALHKDPVLRSSLGKAGRRLVAERYSWDVEGPRFVAHLMRWAGF